MPLSAALSPVFTFRLAKGVLISTFWFFLSLSSTLIEQAASSSAMLAITRAHENLVATFLIILVLRWNLVPRPSFLRQGRRYSEWLQASGRSSGFRQTLPSPHLIQSRDPLRKETSKFFPSPHVTTPN